MSRLLRGILVSAVFLGGTATMEGQPAVEPTRYDAEALRVESKWGNHLLVRGRDGTLVGKIGSGRFDFAAALAPSTNAMQEAKEYLRTHSRGSKILALGIVAVGVGSGIGQMDDIGANVAIPAWTAVAAGTFLMAYGAVQLNKAGTALARSIWWYNRDLGR